jgi:hypothetical protein
MTLNASGPISLGGATTGQSINLELGQAATALASINATNFRTLAGVASGQISLSNFYGKSNYTYFNNVITNQGANPLFSIAADSSNNVYAFGSESAGNQNEYVVKYNSSGTRQWSYNLTDSLSSYGGTIDASGNLYLTGETFNNYLYVAKFNSSGILQWARRLTGDTGILFDVAVNSSGDVYVCGYAGTYAVLAKYNSSGTLQWQRRDAKVSNLRYMGLALDSSDNVYVGGFGNSRGWYAKYNSSGVNQWLRNFTPTNSGSMSCEPGCVAVDSSGNMYTLNTCSRIDGFFTSPRGFQLTKYNSSGTFQWGKIYYAASQSTALEFQTSRCSVDSSGNIYVQGYRTDTGAGLFVKYNSSGVIQWQRALSGSSPNIRDGFFVIGSNFYTSGRNNSQPSLVNFPTDGTKTGTYSWNASTTYGSASYLSGNHTGSYDSQTAVDTAGSLTSAASGQTSASNTINTTTYTF